MMNLSSQGRLYLMSNNVKSYFSMINQKSIETSIIHRMRLDIEDIRRKMKEAKHQELDFYRNLNLSQEAIKRIFDLEAPEKHQIEKKVVWDPMEGNLIMTE